MKTTNPYTIKTDPFSSHSSILQWIHSRPLENKKVIEVGIAEGIIGRIEQKRSYKLIGIELNPEWAEQAKKYYDVIIVGDIQKLNKNTFFNTDIIIMADVLEHLQKPHETLQKIVNYFPLNAAVIISVPNIANIWIRLNLLFGKFDYTEKGILDKTHLHFFTKKSFTQMLESVNLSIVKFDYTPIPLNLVHPFFSDNSFGNLIFRLLNFVSKKIPTLFAYQLLAFCEKR